MLKYISVASTSTIALFCLCLSPLVNPGFSDLGMTNILMTKCLPLAILGIIIAAMDFMTATKQIVNRINDTVNFFKNLS